MRVTMNANKYDVCIVGGCGHVGLPLGISLAQADKKVILYDINTASIETISKGKMPFLETGAEAILKNVIGKTLFLSSNKNVISNSHFVVVVIGTPVDEHLNPKFTIFKNFFDGIVDYLHDNQHVILRSTVYPGTTDKIKRYLQSLNKKTKVSFCPERIAQGKAIEELHSLPQIISAFDEETSDEARRLFSCLTDKVVVLDPMEAELAKLFTNVWRYIQFSISNQFYEIAIQNNLDFDKIFHAIVYEYPRSKGLCGPGFAAGPCLFKDTMQLAAFSNNNFFLGHAAMLVNEGLPNFIVQRLKDKYGLHDKTVGILGMAFKANNDDKRESLSYKLKKILEIEAKQVLCTDVYIQEDGFVSIENLVKNSDIIIVGAAHKQYTNLSIEDSIVLVDIWNLFNKGGSF
jgi:UDP-N-acetyl-D-mannosaminuronic acid dehydrogenase